MVRKRYSKKRRLMYRNRQSRGGTQRLRTGGIMLPRFGNNTIYRFRRTRVTSIVVPYDGVIDRYQWAFLFKLNDLTTFTEFTTLFDKYRITGIRAKFIPRINIFGNSDSSATNTEVPPIMSVIDYDDATAVDYTSLIQFENNKIHNEFKPFTLYFKPQVAAAFYASGAFTSYGTVKNPWIDCNSGGVEYYGLKLATLQFSVSNNPTNKPAWDVIFDYFMEFKYPR